MLRTAALAVLLLSAACASTPRQNRAPTPGAGVSSVGVLVNSTRGRCTWLLVGDQMRRVCAPRGKQPQARDTAATDTTAAGR